YTAATLATALAQNLFWLAAAQFVAEIFLQGEWAVAITIIVEEFPLDARGRALGVVTGMSTLGGIMVGLLAFLGLQNTAIGWRALMGAGRRMDRWGRKPTFSVYMAASLVFGVLLFQTHSAAIMLPVLCLAIFFGLGSGALTSAFATEFFPTYVRSRAAAWCRNAFEIPGGMLGPLVVGLLGDHRSGPIGSIGDAMSLLFLATLIPVLVIGARY